MCELNVYNVKFLFFNVSRVSLLRYYSMNFFDFVGIVFDFVVDVSMIMNLMCLSVFKRLLFCRLGFVMLIGRIIGNFCFKNNYSYDACVCVWFLFEVYRISVFFICIMCLCYFVVVMVMCIVVWDSLEVVKKLACRARITSWFRFILLMSVGFSVYFVILFKLR